MRISDAQFDAMLDEHQECEREMAAERAEMGDAKARRPDARRVATTFGDLRVGDFMTAEEGPAARWVEVVAIGAFKPREPEEIVVTFRVPEPLGVGMADRWVLHRARSEPAVVDGTVRDACLMT